MKISCLAFFLFIITYSALLAEDWPHWRGPHANGVSTETQWDPTALKEGAHILWRAQVGKGHSTVSIKDNRLYTMGNRMTVHPSDTLFHDVVSCLDVETGELVWEHVYEADAGSWPGPGSTPAIEGHRVYTLSRHGHLFCLNAKNGQVIWKRHLAEELKFIPKDRGFFSSPVISGHLLLFNIGESGIALNKTNGQVIWASSQTEWGYASPLLLEHNGKQAAAITGAEKMHVVDVTNGHVLWTFQANQATDPILFKKRLWVAGAASGNKPQSTLLDLSQNHPQPVWQNRNMANAFQNPVLVDNHLYGFGYIKNKCPFQCVDMETGELKWSRDLGQFGAVSASGDRLIIIQGDGQLIIAQASPKGWQVLSQDQALEMGDPSLPMPQRCCCWIDPVLANGRIYVRNNWGELVCVDVRK